MDAADRTGSLQTLRRELVAWLGPDASATWLVGGVVRDALLERPLLDVDLATSVDPQRVARAIAVKVDGTAFALGDRPGGGGGCWRVMPRDADASVQYDVCALRGGTIDADLAARDFTANAMAVALDRDGTIVDPHHGRRDLEAETVRMVSTAALDDDPLRMLRAARIAHLLGWDIDAGTVDAVRARAGRAVEPAGERTFHELQLLLLHREAKRGWRLLEQLGLDAVLLPELDACRGMTQSRFHHLDVHDHTLAVLDNCEDLLGATEFWIPLPDEPGLVADDWTDEQRLTVLLAALCHDLGKPATRSEHPDGRVSFIGHDDIGRDIVDAIAERWRWSSLLRRRVGQLVSTHLELGYLLHTDRGARERWRLRRQFGDVTAEAVVLSVGDRLATSGLDDRRRWVRAHLSLAREVWADHWRERRDGIPVPLLDGHDIAQVIGGELPGPQIGELVQALAQAQAVSEVTSREDAERLVRELSAATARSTSPDT
jgi:tRNA nucleotidyltransferase/poly(A) polymerase